jgi:chromosome segregation ATPase
MIPVRAPPQSAEQELAAIKEYRKELEAEKADLEKEMNEVEARFNELKTKLQGKGQPQKP